MNNNKQKQSSSSSSLILSSNNGNNNDNDSNKRQKINHNGDDNNTNNESSLLPPSSSSSSSSLPLPLSLLVSKKKKQIPLIRKHSSARHAPPVLLDCNKQHTYISRLVLQMQKSLQQLNATNITFDRLEEMAILIHESMSSSSRNYHSVQHVFDISKKFQETDPIATLAALFHDVIYYHVDGKLTPMQLKSLHGVVVLQKEQKNNNNNHNNETNDKSHHHHHHDTTTPTTTTTTLDQQCVCMVETIFGYESHQLITYSSSNSNNNASSLQQQQEPTKLITNDSITKKQGFNEFLSAIIAVRTLQNHVTMEQLAQIACCIEATIPFRSPCTTTTTTKNKEEIIIIDPMQQLYNNMITAKSKYNLQLSNTQLVQSVQRAALLANEDVGNFASTDRYWFLDNTWSLLPETNQSLRQQYLYTVLEYQHAVYKMNGFFTSFINPDNVFVSFQNVPSHEEITHLRHECVHNLNIGKTYVGAKLLAASVLAAFAISTGGDAPMSLFMGDLPSRHYTSTKIEDSLLAPPASGLMYCDPTVYTILAHGRRAETTFDIKQSPLASYLYGWLGTEKLHDTLKRCTLYPMNEENGLYLLRQIPKTALDNVAESMAKVALSRADRIWEFMEKI